MSVICFICDSCEDFIANTSIFTESRFFFHLQLLKRYLLLSDICGRGHGGKIHVKVALRGKKNNLLVGLPITQRFNEVNAVRGTLSKKMITPCELVVAIETRTCWNK